jgi:hypothetical protein
MVNLDMLGTRAARAPLVPVNLYVLCIWNFLKDKLNTYFTTNPRR